MKHREMYGVFFFVIFWGVNLASRGIHECTPLQIIQPVHHQNNSLAWIVYADIVVQPTSLSIAIYSIYLVAYYITHWSSDSTLSGLSVSSLVDLQVSTEGGVALMSATGSLAVDSCEEEKGGGRHLTRGTVTILGGKEEEEVQGHCHCQAVQ